MSALLLAIAMATAVQPQADVLMASAGEVGAAAVTAEIVEPVACAPRAGLANAEEVPPVGGVEAVRATGVEEVPPVVGAGAAKPEIEVVTAAGGAPAAKSEVEPIPAVGTAAKSAAGDQPVWDPVMRRGSCDLLALYTRSSFLSGPWGAARRLKAARLRGDAAEVRRMEAKLAELLGAALMTEKGGPR